MSSGSIPLELIGVASPCTEAWDAMQGDDRSRFCDRCRQHVFNLSNMNRAEAEALIQQTVGRVCVRYYQRHDGTVLTSDCPVGSRTARQFRIAASLAFAGLGLLVGGALTVLSAGRQDEKGRRLRDIEPFHSIVEWFSPSPPPVVMGRVCIPDEMPPQPPDAPAP